MKILYKKAKLYLHTHTHMNTHTLLHDTEVMNLD